MPSYGLPLSIDERNTLNVVVTFLESRLEEQGTIDWALALRTEQRVERLAILQILTGTNARDLCEPWATAWRLIEESWLSTPVDTEGNASIYAIQKRLRSGDRSGALIAEIIRLVRPWPKVEAIEKWRWNYVKRPRKPKKVEHVLSATLTSGGLPDLSLIEPSRITELPFLVSLAGKLEEAVNHGLDIASRLGRDRLHSFAGLGFLNRVYYTQASLRAGETDELDAFHKGIAPSVKLLNTVVSRIVEIDVTAARRIINRWQTYGSPVYTRLLAAIARDPNVANGLQVGEFLAGLNRDHFWDLQQLPEVAELRATRFGDLEDKYKKIILNRIKAGPPRHFWPNDIDSSQANSARLYWVSRELRRIEVAGGVLPLPIKLQLARDSNQFADLSNMEGDNGFLGGPTLLWRQAKPDLMLDHLSGTQRLKALETALGTSPMGWNDDPAENANDWMTLEGRAELILLDLESDDDCGSNFPKVWNRFGWLHKPHDVPQTEDAEHAQTQTANRVLVLLQELSEPTLVSAIEGVCQWLDNWKKQVVQSPILLQVWLRTWPIAIEATNQKPFEVNEVSLKATELEAESAASLDIETLNTPTGKLVGVFLAACPVLSADVPAFREASIERRMRDVVISAEGRSKLIAKYLMVVHLPYFLQADNTWAKQYLVDSLMAEDDPAQGLWRAVARRTHFHDTLLIIGEEMALRASSRSIPRQTKQSFVFSIVVEVLYAFLDNRASAVPHQRVLRMLRSIDDETRTSAARAIETFLRDVSSRRRKDGSGPPTAANLFRRAVHPMLRDVWPQERSLTTPGVSSALARLPACSGDAFAEAVDAIARFLIPFDCWSLFDLGFYDASVQATNFDVVKDRRSASALLDLLDLTLGRNEGAVIPHDLGDALDCVLEKAPALVDSSKFQRLVTAARR